jgi:large subunit ribosomal protein L5
MQEKLKTEVLPALREKLGYSNPHAMPKLEKIVINMGLGKPMGIGSQSENKGVMEAAIKDLTTITGQKPLVTKARISVASFKIRQGKEVGITVTLRRQRMWEFLDRLITITIPRIRDFRGFPQKGFDQAGNYTFGLTEQSVFPEIDLTKVQKTLGMNITLTIRARKRQDAVEFLKTLGFPFRSN